MIRIFWIFLLLINLTIKGQTQIKPILYLDTDLQQIDELTYINKKLKRIYAERNVEKDSFTIKMLREVYKFDSLNNIELIQTQNIFRKYLGINDFNKPIIISYVDSLLGYKEVIGSRAHRIANDAMDLDSEKKYLERRENYDKKQKKCKKFVRKNDITAIYGYSGKKNFTYQPKYYERIKLPSVIKSIFFKNKKRGSIILKPNGEYFFFNFLTEKQIKRMLYSDWRAYIEQYKTVKNVTNKYNLNFINKMNQEYENDIRKIIMREVNTVKYKKPQYRPKLIITRGKTPPYNCLGYASY